MKKINLLLLIISILVVSGCVESQPSFENDTTVSEIEETRKMSFDLPDDWTRHTDDEFKAIFGPAPDAEIAKEFPATIVTVSRKGEGDIEDAKTYAQEGYKTALELFPNSNPTLNERTVNDLKIYYLEKDAMMFEGECEKEDTNIYFSKEGNVYLIKLMCDSLEKHLDMIETVVSTIKLQ